MNVFISGGAKNGKSSFAQKYAFDMAGENKLYYLATMVAVDEEDENRIKRHIEDRDGMGFITVEKPMNMCELFEAPYNLDRNGVFLLDSVTAQLANAMFGTGEFDKDAAAKVADDLVRFAKISGNVVFVSDYIYSEARIFDDFTESYRRGLALIDRKLAEVCDMVCEVVCGNVITHKAVLHKSENNDISKLI